MSYMTHCRTFSAESSGSDIICDLIDRLHAVNAPLLQSFQIECYGRGIDDYGDDNRCEASHHNIINGGAPALTSIWIDSWSLYGCLPPLSNVTTLILLSPSPLMEWTAFWEMVDGHLALTRLVIGNIFVDDGYIPDNLTIVLPLFKSLCICVSDIRLGYRPDQILLGIAVSALEVLALD